MYNADVLVAALRRRICIHSAVSGSADHDQDFMRRGQFDKMTSRSVDSHTLQGRPEHLGEACVCATSAVQTQQDWPASVVPEHRCASEIRFGPAGNILDLVLGKSGRKGRPQGFRARAKHFSGMARTLSSSRVVDNSWRAVVFFHDMRASAVAFPRRTQCAPTANVGGTRRHRTAELAHGITLVGWARLASIMSRTSLLELFVVLFFCICWRPRV